MAEGRPNILLIMSDQQQWQTIAGRSLCRMPSVQRLVNGGMLFDRAYTPSALCCPARAMLLSGAYHWHNGVFNQVHSSPSVSRDMRPDVVTYSQRLKDAGYYLGYVGKWHASYRRTPLDFGFDEIGQPRSYNPRLLERAEVVEEALGHLPKGPHTFTSHRDFSWPGDRPRAMWGVVDGPEEGTGSARIAECARLKIRRFARAEGPWHLEVHFPEPHDVYAPLHKYLDRYDAREIPLPESFADTFEGKPGMHRRESETWGELTENDVREGLAHYFAYCEELDARVGRVLDALEESGEAENTIVIYTTDHGDMVGAHRMYIKGWMPYEECYRIPLVIRWPEKIRAGQVSERLVQLHDLGHTLLDVLDLDPLPYEDGRSLAPLFDDPRRGDWPDRILCAYYGGEFVYSQRMVITERYKYVFNAFDFDELYDLQEDPCEMRNLIADSETAGELREMMYELCGRFGDPLSGEGEPPDDGGQPPNRYGLPRYLPRKRAEGG